MSSLENTTSSIKSKLGFHLDTPKPHTVFTSRCTAKHKMTVYMDDERHSKFNELVIARMKSTGKSCRSEIICEMVDLYYEKSLSS